MVAGGSGLALVLVTHNSARELDRFLPGQAHVASELDAPVVIVDNASSDQTVEVVHAYRDGPAEIRLVEMGRNAGYAAAVNAGFQATDGDVMLINPDVELADAEAVRTLARLLAENSDVAVAAPRLVGPDGRPQASARRYPSLLAVLGAQGRFARVGPVARARERYLAPSEVNHPAYVDWVIGAAMLIRRAAYEAVAGWDERFFLYVEDTDFCRRLTRAAWHVVYTPDVALQHVYPQSSSGHDPDGAARRARRRHLVGFARLFAREPRLLFGLGRRRVEPIAEPR